MQGGSRWTAEDKIRIVMESLTTSITVAELCRKYNVKPTCSIPGSSALSREESWL